VDARDHLLELIVAGVMRERREAHKLKVGEAGFENHVGGDMEFNRVLAGRDRTYAPNLTAGSSEPRSRGSGCGGTRRGRPKQAIARRALSRPKRAPRRLPMAPVNSASGKAA
jgi:hypothetical protein